MPLQQVIHELNLSASFHAVQRHSLFIPLKAFEPKILHEFVKNWLMVNAIAGRLQSADT